MLQNSLSIGSKVIVLSNIKPMYEDFIDTINTLNFTNVCKQCELSKIHHNRLSDISEHIYKLRQNQTSERKRAYNFEEYSSRLVKEYSPAPIPPLFVTIDESQSMIMNNSTKVRRFVNDYVRALPTRSSKTKRTIHSKSITPGNARSVNRTTNSTRSSTNSSKIKKSR